MAGLFALFAPFILMGFAIGMEHYELFAKNAGRRKVSSPSIEVR
ncbi:hypothetical protein ACGE24_07235 [Corynebacterium kroppenstedtii]